MTGILKITFIKKKIISSLKVEQKPEVYMAYRIQVI